MDDYILISKEIEKHKRAFGLSPLQYDYDIIYYEPAKGQENAFECIKRFINHFLKNFDTGYGLLLVGGVGSGKTFLVSCVVTAVAKAMANDSAEIGRFRSWGEYTHDDIVMFVNPIEMFRKLKEEYGEVNLYYLRQLQDTALLILDDLGIEKSNDWTKERLYEIIDYRYNNYLPIIITTNCVPEELKEKIGDRCFDRLREMCTLIPVTAESQRETARYYAPKTSVIVNKTE